MTRPDRSDPCSLADPRSCDDPRVWRWVRARVVADFNSPTGESTDLYLDAVREHGSPYPDTVGVFRIIAGELVYERLRSIPAAVRASSGVRVAGDAIVKEGADGFTLKHDPATGEWSPIDPPFAEAGQPVL